VNLPEQASRLLRWNASWNTPGVCNGLTILCFVLAATTYVGHTHLQGHLVTPPPPTGDAPGYDSLGWELSQGHGFQVDLTNPDFLKPYQEASPTPDAVFPPPHVQGPITTRPPLMPAVMAATNRIWGRQFWAIRIVNMLAMAATCALAVWTTCRIAGPVPALITAGNFVIVDWRTRAYARDILTESFACLFVALLAVALTRLSRRRSSLAALVCGLLMGLSILARSMFVLWAPGLILAIAMGGRWSLRSTSSASWRRAGLSLIAACVVVAPWVVRNCRVSGRFLPLGAQGQIELSAAYSDEAFRRGGMWHNLQEAGFFASLPLEGRPALEQEQLMADFSRVCAADWVKANPHKVPLLAVMKVIQEFRPHGPGELYVLAFAVLGLLLLRGTPWARWAAWILLVGALSIAGTWSTSGRFVVPLLSILHTAAGVGLWAAIIAVTSGRDAVLNWMDAAESVELDANRQEKEVHP